MTTDSLVGIVKHKVELVKAHAPEVVKTGVETLRAAQGVVADARRDAGKVPKKRAKRGQADANAGSSSHDDAAQPAA